MKRRNPRITVAVILGILGGILSIPVVDYLRDYFQGREDRFLYPLGFETGITGTPTGWVLALLVAAAFILFTIKGIPAVAETWREVSSLKVISIYVAIVVFSAAPKLSLIRPHKAWATPNTTADTAI